MPTIVLGPRFDKRVPLTHRRVHALIAEVDSGRISDSLVHRVHGALREVAANCWRAAQVAAFCRQELELDDITDLLAGIESDDAFEAELDAAAGRQPADKATATAGATR